MQQKGDSSTKMKTALFSKGQKRTIPPFVRKCDKEGVKFRKSGFFGGENRKQKL